MLRTRNLTMAAIGVTLLAALILLPLALRAQQAEPHHPLPSATKGGVVVMLCDGKTSMEVSGLKPGQTMSHAQALTVTHQLMERWQREHPNQHWQMAQASKSQSGGGAGAPATAGGEVTGVPIGTGGVTQQGDTYASFHQRDYQVWANETQKFVDEGKRIFHDSKALGSTIGVSCDMCHPDASNTHPETYPKYQVQLQRVALLRDMIDWCIENPVKGPTLDDPNSEKLRALEAYILAQRKGVALNYGKH